MTTELPEPEMEGIVAAFSPASDQATWEIGVWLPKLEELWMFKEDELAHTGFVEETVGDAKRRLPLIDALPDDTLDYELEVRVLTTIDSEEAASHSAAVARASLERILALIRADVRIEREPDPPNHFRIDLRLQPAEGSRHAFETLTGHVASGWVQQLDDGWRSEYWWKRAESTEKFLIDDEEYVIVTHVPWSDPTRRRL
jgi:hypothetical protein